jgi:hypothetical protein
MAIQIASGTIYAHFPDHLKRSRIIWPAAVSGICPGVNFASSVTGQSQACAT